MRTSIARLIVPVQGLRRGPEEGQGEAWEAARKRDRMRAGDVDETREESPDAILGRGVSRRGALDPAGPCAGKKAPAAGQCEAGREAVEGRREGLQVRARKDPGHEPEARPVGERARGAQAEVGGRGCARRLSAATSLCGS